MTQSRRAALTRRQTEVLAFIGAFIEEHRFPPTVREISAACALGSPTGARRMLDALECKGYVARSPGRRRALSLVEPPVEAANLSAEEHAVLGGLAWGQALARDYLLIVAGRVESSVTKHALLRDALERDALVAHVDAALGTPPQVLPAEISLREMVLRALTGERYWPAFVVNHLLLNALSLSPARGFANGSVVALREPATRSAALCEKGISTAGTWLEELTACTSPPGVRGRIKDDAARFVDGYTAVGRALERVCAGTGLRLDTPPEVHALLSV